MKSHEEIPVAGWKYVLFMKIGYHAGETLEDIIDRKRKEETLTGQFFWGYGGTICHPTNQVLRFLSLAQSEHDVPVVAMIPTLSRYLGSGFNSKEYSLDQKTWLPLPDGISVLGSKFALVCTNLRKFNCVADLVQYKVAIGPSAGRTVMEYFRYHVGKVCAIKSCFHTTNSMRCKVPYIADLVFPGAVFLR